MAVGIEIKNIATLDRLSTINENFNRVEEALQDAVSRSGNSPNSMDADLDMDSNDLLNVGLISAEDISIDGSDVTGILERAETAAEEAEISAIAADASADAAAASAASVPVFSAFWLTVVGAVSAAASWLLLNVLGHLTGRSLIKALVPSTGMAVYLSESNRSGTFVWRLGNYTSYIAADTTEAIYLKADSVAASTGAWVRVMKAGEGIDPMWCGALGTDTYNAAGADDTAAFNAAVALAIFEGRHIQLPNLNNGRMLRLTSEVTVNKGIKIIGTGPMHSAGGGANESTPSGGSWIHFDHTGIGMTFYDSTNSNAMGWYLENVGIYRSQPAASAGAWSPTAHDFDFYLRGNTKLINVLCLKSTKGIYVYGAVLDIDRLQGQFFTTGIEYRRSADVNRLYHLHFWPYWSQLAGVKASMIANLTCVKVNRCDGLHIHDIFGIWMHRLLHFDDSPTAEGSATAAFYINGLYADGCDGAIEINSSDAANTRGCYGHIDSCMINCESTTGSGRGIYVLGTNPSRITIDGLHCTRARKEIIRAEDAAHDIRVSGEGFLQAWNADGSGAKAFAVDDGARISFATRPIGVTTAIDYAISNIGTTGGIYISGVGMVIQVNLTIVSGVITVPGPGQYTIDTEGGAGTDDLDTITAGAAIVWGDRITISPTNSSHDPTAKDGTGNLVLAGDFAMLTNSYMLDLVYNGAGSWRETSRSAN